MSDTDKLLVIEGMPETDEDDEFMRLLEREAALEESVLHLPKGYLSVSQVAMYLRCGAAYEYRYVKDIIRAPGVALAEGSAMHKALEVALREKMEKHTIAPISVLRDAWHETWEQKAKDVVEWGDDGKNSTQSLITSRSEQLIRVYHKEKLPVANPVGVEKRFWTMIGAERTPVLGYVDLVDAEIVNSLPGPTVVDHKVVRAAKSQSETDSDMQLTVYAQTMGTPRVRFDSFVKTKTPKIQTTRSIRTQKDFAHVARLFDDVARAISSGTFMACDPTSWNCSPKWCGYYKDCRGR